MHINHHELDDVIALAAGEHQRVGDLLRTTDLISAEQLATALVEQERRGGRLGDILVNTGLLTRLDRDVVLEFQRQQDSPALSDCQLCLGNILVTTGQITREQLGEAQKQQLANGGRLGQALIAAGYATLKQVTRGLSLQQKLVAKALLKAMSVAALLVPPLPSAQAGQSSVNLQVSAIVVAKAQTRTDYQAASLTISQDDIAQGHIDVTAASRFSVVTNSRTGYLLDFYPVGEVFQSVEIKGWGYTTKIGADGGTVVRRGPVENNAAQELSYRFFLRSNLPPGSYPWPLMLSVRPL
jgi:archaellin